VITNRQWLAFSLERRTEKFATGLYTIIPSNDFGIVPGYYRDEDLMLVLRERRRESAVVNFILEMADAYAPEQKEALCQSESNPATAGRRKTPRS